MKKHIYISIFGFIGAILRMYIKNSNVHILNNIMPYKTLIINVGGSFILSLILTLALILEFDENLRIGVGTGFCGAFTTFSTFCKEITTLVKENQHDLLH